MEKFIRNEEGIYVRESAVKVDYPEVGHTDSLGFEEESFWFRHRNEVILEVMRKVVADGNFVDIGGGNGLQAAFIQKQLPGKEVALVEPGYSGCRTASRRGVKHIYNGLFQDFDFHAFGASAVGLFDVVEHIEQDSDFLSTLKSKLRPGSHILITVPAYNWLWSELDDYGHHYRRYNKKMISELAKRSGLRIRYFSYFFSYLVPLTYLLRTIPYKWRGQRTKDEMIAMENEHHKPHPVIAAAFALLGRMELYFIKKSSCNFGASIIVALEVP